MGSIAPCIAHPVCLGRPLWNWVSTNEGHLPNWNHYWDSESKSLKKRKPLKPNSPDKNPCLPEWSPDHHEYVLFCRNCLWKGDQRSNIQSLGHHLTPSEYLQGDATPPIKYIPQYEVEFGQRMKDLQICVKCPYFQKDPFGNAHYHCGKSVNYSCTCFIPNCHLSLEIDIPGSVSWTNHRQPRLGTPNKSTQISWSWSPKFKMGMCISDCMPSVKRDQTICPWQVDFLSTADMLSTIP